MPRVTSSPLSVAMQLLLLVVVCCVGGSLVVGGTAAAQSIQATGDPPPPVWANQFMFIASVQDKAGQAFGSTQYYYDWSIPAVAQVTTSSMGEEFTILNHGGQTWRVNVGNKTCCLCTSPYSCGHATPPIPNWLQTGNNTKYWRHS